MPGGVINIFGATVIPPSIPEGTPELSFVLANHTRQAWRDVDLTFDIDANCEGTPNHWSVSEHAELRYIEFFESNSQSFLRVLDSLAGKVAGCEAKRIVVTLVSAENLKYRVDGTTGETIDLDKQRAADADKARSERAAQEIAEKRKRAAAQLRRKKLKADEDAQAAAQRAKLVADCRAIYDHTAQKKVSDLTVEESLAIEGCERLNLYPPQ